jgi:hypothetical protein
MSLVIKSEFTPHPDGVFPGVCVDVVDLGMVTNNFGTKHMIKVVWETDQKMDDGRPFTVQKRYTASLHEKSTLAKDLKTWRGRPFTPEEMRGFDIDKVVGAPCQLVIVHAEKEGAVYANVTTVMKADPAKRLAPTGKYVRQKDRPADQQQRAAGGNGRPTGAEPEAEEIPF